MAISGGSTNRTTTDTGSASGAGSTVGPYRIGGLLGRGGMGEVFRAYDERRQRTVALKLLPAVLSSDQDYRERFRRESLAAATLTSPHVVPIHDFGEIDGRLFIDMRLIDGTDLGAVAAHGPMEPQRAVAIVSQVGQALGDAHARGVVHRDVKPSNIIVTEDDFAYLVDFGIAQSGDAASAGSLTHTGMTVGTFGYMAPERFDAGTRSDARSDVYSLACVLSELLTGHRPFAQHQSAPALIRAHLLEAPPRPSALNPSLPGVLDDVVARGMAKDPMHRYSTAAEFCAAATAVLGMGSRRHSTRGVTSFAGDLARPQRAIATQLGSAGSPNPSMPLVTPQPPPGGAPTEPRGSRRGIALAVAATVLLAAGVAGGVLWSSTASSDSSRPPASGQVVGQTEELPADLQGRWQAYTLSDLGRMQLTLDGGEVESIVGTATTNPLFLIGPGVTSPAPCAYSVELVSALSGDRGDQATLRLVLDENEQRRQCATSASINLERTTSSYVQIQPGGELCFQACKPAQIGGSLQPA